MTGMGLVGYFLLQAVRCPGKYKLIVFMQYTVKTDQLW